MQRTELDGVTINAVNSLGSDGVMTYLSTSNSTRYKWAGPATADAPPLTLEEMLATAESDAWRS